MCRKKQGKILSMQNDFSCDCFVERQGVDAGTLHYNSTIAVPPGGFTVFQKNGQIQSIDENDVVINQQRGHRGEKVDPNSYAIFFINKANVDGIWKGTIKGYDLTIRYEFRSHIKADILNSIRYNTNHYSVKYFQDHLNLFFPTHVQDFLEKILAGQEVRNDLAEAINTDKLNNSGLDIMLIQSIEVKGDRSLHPELAI